MNEYTKISLIIAIEVVILGVANIIVKLICTTFNSWYIVVGQFALLQI